ncbi:MAG: hypothetical protein GC185_11355 [Alphaproteobacteria bacterium]|nr:hypothetical protein [Alphaproteobacteria bacterium]
MAENKHADKLAGREVLLEYQRVGNIMRVSAMDVQSLTEIVVQCPAGAGDAVFRKNALLRLSYVLKKKGILPGD